MAREAKRGCGYRKVGGLYMVSGKFNASCRGLPFRLDVCPVCSSGIRQARGWTWIEPMQLFTQDTSSCRLPRCGDCPVSNPPPGRHGLLWVGVAHYPLPGDFMAEARRLGVCRRIQFVPHDFELGKTYVYLAHMRACITRINPAASAEHVPGIISVFMPERIELIITPEQAKDAEFLGKCDKRGIVPVILDESETEDEEDDEREQAELLL